MLKFKGMIRRVGNSWMVTVPSDYINHGMVGVLKDYEFIIKKLEDDMNCDMKGVRHGESSQEDNDDENG
jgi:hypothetical protein